MPDVQEKLKKLYDGKKMLLPLDIIKIASKSRLKRLKKGDFFIREGELNYNTCVVLKGLLRHYIIDENGEEKNIRFVAEKGQSGSPDTLFNNEKSSEFIEALEDCILIVMDFRFLQELSKKNERILRLQNQSYEATISENVKYIRFLNCNTPEKRYRHFRMEYPHLEDRIKQKHLASYLGVTATSLSRMKARIESENSKILS